MKFSITVVLLLLSDLLLGQSTFKCGWDTYKTAMIVHEYTYSYVFKDSVRFFLADSTKTYIAPDSQVAMNVTFPFQNYNTIFKTANFYNAKKKLVKCEETKDNLLQSVKEYKYDDKNRVTLEIDDNKVSKRTFKRTYEYTTEKNGDNIIKQVSYFNGAIEFYTRTYMDKDNRKVKEVRLNDNNKDIVHSEYFYYTSDGRLKERTVFFPEWKVTKKFDEAGGEDPAKCFKALAVNIADKPSVNSKISFLRKLLTKNQAMLLDPDCHNFTYRFYSPDCEVLVRTTKTNNIKEVIFRYKERLHY